MSFYRNFQDDFIRDVEGLGAEHKRKHIEANKKLEEHDIKAKPLNIEVHLRLYHEAFQWMYREKKIQSSAFVHWPGWDAYQQRIPKYGVPCLERETRLTAEDLHVLKRQDEPCRNCFECIILAKMGNLFGERFTLGLFFPSNGNTRTRFRNYSWY